MGLQDLNEELYTREGVDRKNTRSRLFDAGVGNANEGAFQEAFKQRGAWDAQPESFMSHHRKAIRRGLIISGLIIVSALSYFVFIRIQQASFSSDRVTMQIDGPSDVSGSESSLFVFTYSNNNRSELTDAELTLTYPENFRPDPLENMSINGMSSQVHIFKIAGHSKGKIELRGKFYGSKGTLAYIRGVLRYKPEALESSFQSESQIGITIQSPSIKLSLDAPLEVSSGGLVEYRVDYTNLSDVTFEHLRLKVDYPEGFHFQSSDPKSSEGESVWYVGNLLAGKTGSIHVTGTMDGTKNEAKVLKAHIGILQGNGDLLSYSDGDRLTKIVASPLTLQQTVNDVERSNVNPGSVLRYNIRYRNDGEVGLRDVIITASIEGSVLDFSNLSNNGGAFDNTRKMITWKASDVPELANLAPGKGGIVSFSIPLLNSMPIQTDQDKNFVVTSTAKIDSPDIATPIGSNKIINSNTSRVKVNSIINIQSQAVFQDTTIPNTGTVPPQVGKETTYTMHWIASNASNDVDKAVVMAYLPTGVRFTGATSPSSETISYNERTNQIVWNIGNIQSGTGSLRPVKEVMFQVGITPQVNQSGQSAHLLEETTFSAHDLFTDENLQVNAIAPSTNIAQ